MSRHQGIGMTSQRTRERLAARLGDAGIRDVRVLDVMRRVPRHLFVDEALATRAYEDTALPIGYGQTISQPYTVARMTEVLMEVEPKKVLEVGSGCGYQSAVLAHLVAEVYSVERIQALVRRARESLSELRINNVRLRHGDGYAGWPVHAPYDAILVAAAPTEVPPALLEQLADGGRLVIPTGNGREQRLICITREGNICHERELEPVSFVPLTAGVER